MVEAGNQVLRFGSHVSEMGKLDPHFAAGSQDRAVADMVFNVRYFEDLNRAPNADIGPKDFFEMAYSQIQLALP